MAKKKKSGAQILYSIRWVLLILGVLLVGGSAGYLMIVSEGETSVLITLAIFFFSQYLFLTPGKNFSFKLANKTSPMWHSMAILAIVMGIVSIGFILALTELFYDEEKIFDHLTPMLGWSTLFLIWLAWALFFYWRWKSWKKNRYATLTKLLRGAIAGTFLDLIVSLFTFATVKDPDNCACGRGSFWGLALGISAAAWLFGPGIVLLFIYEKQKRLYNRAVCKNCQYDLRGSLNSDTSTCPECGHAFDPQELQTVVEKITNTNDSKQDQAQH